MKEKKEEEDDMMMMMMIFDLDRATLIPLISVERYFSLNVPINGQYPPTQI